MKVEQDCHPFFLDLATWARSHSDVEAILLVGSYARGEPNPDSDIDLVVLAQDRDRLIKDFDWIETFGKPERVSFEPIDPGTQQVIEGGARILFDRNGRLADAVAFIRRRSAKPYSM